MQNESVTISLSDGVTFTIKFSDLTILPVEEIRGECCMLVNIENELTPIIVTVPEYMRLAELKEQYIINKKETE